jgi:hypothetical protein
MKNLVGQFSGKKLRHGGVVSTIVFLLAILSLFWTYESHADQWVQMTSGTDKYLWGVWGSSGNDVYAVGEGMRTGIGRVFFCTMTGANGVR